MNKEDEVDKMMEEELSQFEQSLSERGKENIEGHKEDRREDSPKDEEVLEEKKEEVTDESTDESDDIDIEWIDISENKPKKSTKDKVIDIFLRYGVMLIALIAFAYASYELTIIYVESKEGIDLKNSTSDMFLVDIEDLTDDYEAVTGENGENLTFENENDGQLFVFDYEKMLEYNSHAKGYIRQGNGEYIDNPILQHPDNNDYYLDHLVDHKKSSLGSIYIDTSIKDGLNAKNCIIYGHNMGERAGRIMFGSLNWYYNKTGYYKDPQNTTFDIWIENTRYRYYVFAIYKTDAVGSWVYRYGFESDEQFMEYIDKCKQTSKYYFKDAPEITKDSMIITLSTCTHTDEKRMIVQLVRGEELDIYGNPIGAESETTDDAQ